MQIDEKTYEAFRNNKGKTPLGKKIPKYDGIEVIKGELPFDQVKPGSMSPLSISGASHAVRSNRIGYLGTM
jgi:hypothetical protein